MAQQTERDLWVTKLRDFLTDHHYSRHAIKNYSFVARRFLDYIKGHQISIESVQTDCVAAYLRLELNRYRRKHGRNPRTIGRWRWHLLSPIHKLLSLAQGVWPPVSAAKARVRLFAGELRAEERSPFTVSTYVRVAHGFLRHLGRAGIDLRDAEPAQVSSFIDEELRRYQQRNHRLPARLVNWRCGLTSPVHMLLRKVRGVWPPAELPHPAIEKLEQELKNDDFASPSVARYLCRARDFHSHLKARGIAVEHVDPVEVEFYCRRQLAKYRNKHGRRPPHDKKWVTGIRGPLNRLLRVVQGVWPPGSEPDPLIEEFRQHLVAQGFAASVKPSYLSAVRCFLHYLKEHRRTIASVRPEDVTRYLKARLALYRGRKGCEPGNIAAWRQEQVSPIHRLLRLVQGQWPPTLAPANKRELWRGELLSGYVRWMVDLRGLSQPTVRKNSDAARVFLEWLGETAQIEKLQEVTVLTIDRFLAWRNPKLRRATRHGVVCCLRDFFRFLHGRGHLQRDLSSAVPGVKLYRYEDMPKAFSPHQIKAVLEHICKDDTPIGLRDYAIALLLARYGVRAGEVVRLRLEDINWRQEEFRVIQSKSHLPLRLPLSSDVGNAILRYLQHGRQQSKAREVFLRSRAPHGPFIRGSSLGSIIERRLQQADVRVEGRHGTHAFRYAHAVNLLRAQIPLKTIGDLLGHRSPTSTSVYLKLSTEDLRSVSLEVPVGGAQ